MGVAEGGGLFHLDVGVGRGEEGERAERAEEGRESHGGWREDRRALWIRKRAGMLRGCGCSKGEKVW